MGTAERRDSTVLDQDPILNELAGIGQWRRYSAGQFIVMQDEAAMSLFLMLSGSVAVCVGEQSGDETVLSYLFAGEIFGELSLSEDGATRSANVIAREDVEVLEVAYRDYFAAAQKNPELWLRIIRQLSRRLRQVTDRVRLLACHPMGSRIVNLLRELSEQPDAVITSRGRQLTVTRQELAKMAGCTREVVSRSLRDIARTGLIELEGRTILVTGLLTSTASNSGADLA